MLGALLLVVAQSAPIAAQDRETRPAVPMNPGSWVMQNDYPASALRAGEEGVVGYVLDVDSTGKASNCRVSESSGSIALDVATCVTLSQRARFLPALADGRFVASTFTGRVRWLMPSENDPENQTFLPNTVTPFTLAFSMYVDKEGNLSDCKVERREGSIPEPMDMARECEGPVNTMGGRITPFRDAAGHPVEKRIRTTISMEVVDPRP